MGQDGTPAAAAARWLGVSWSTAMNTVRDVGGRLLEEQTAGLRGVRMLCTGRTPLAGPAG